MTISDEYLETFVVECRELLEQMEESLLAIEQDPTNSEILNAIFRAAHTIKGSAGLFGLEFIVEFTHIAESVLDRARSGEVIINSSLAALFIEVHDHLGNLVDLVVAGSQPSDELKAFGKRLTSQLQVYLGSSGGAEPEVHRPVVQQAKTEITSENKANIVASECWHISLRFGIDVFRNGMDPFSFVRCLYSLGEVVELVTIIDAIPSAEDLDPESCHLGFEISFRSDAEKIAIENVFNFVRSDCVIHILPPHSKISEYQDFIRDLPEEEMRLGEILVKCGTLTQEELDGVLRIQSVLTDDEPPRPIGEVLVQQQLVSPPVVEAALKKQEHVKEQKKTEANLIRVDADKLDELINLVGELIIAGAGTNLIARNAGMTDLMESTATLSRLVEEVRDSALALRMVQIGGTFNRFQRVVRDVSKELGKDIDLVISGAETELDKTVVEKIGDPLTHLVRNSMDHGIESADIRIARGKPAKGTLKLNAYHDAGSIVIEVNDDGGGLNKAKILSKAVERGLVAEGANLSDKEIYNLIFEAGFSTADVVSNLSGRGVGMDVVRRNIQALRGRIELDSNEGHGSTVRIRLPLTLAIIDGFMVSVGNTIFVIPLDMVVECIELNAWIDRELLDVETISNDYCCDFGKWLHGTDSFQANNLQSYHTCIATHAEFHIEAGKVATIINHEKYDQAQKLLESDSNFSKASEAVGVAIANLKKDLAVTKEINIDLDSILKKHEAWKAKFSSAIANNSQIHSQYLNLRGEVLPYRRLRDYFETNGDIVQRENVVVVRYGEHKAGLVVDKLMGEFQTVIKPLGKLFSGEKSIGGFTILGNGEVALIVDIPGLMNQIEHEKETGMTALTT